MKDIFKYINAKQMFADYIPHIPCRYLKKRGKDTYDKPLHFTEEEKRIILQGIRDMAEDIYIKHIDKDPSELY